MSTQADDHDELGIAGVSENLAEVAKEDQLSQEQIDLARPLSNFSVGISISESEEIEQLGLSNVHQKDFMVEVARHLLVQGATLVYGGDLRMGGYTRLFAELSHQYRNKQDRHRFPFRNYFSYPIHVNLDKSGLTELKNNRVEVIKVEPAPELTVNPDEFVKPITPEGKYVWARSLSHMRRVMDESTNARVFIGGPNYKYKGKYPGIVEEAYYAYASNKPVYLVGAFGGATGRMIQAFKGNSVVIEEDPFYQTEEHQEFITHHNSTAPDSLIDFEDLNLFFKEKTVEWLSENNGLSVEENQRLFVSLHLPEVVYLIMKGLNKVAGQR